MIIYGTHNEEATLSLYSFEEQEATPAGDAWLQIKLNIYDTEHDWHKVDPALTAGEVLGLAGWFHRLAAREDTCKDVYFIEPCLSFHLVHDTAGSQNDQSRFQL